VPIQPPGVEQALDEGEDDDPTQEVDDRERQDERDGRTDGPGVRDAQVPEERPDRAAVRHGRDARRLLDHQ